MLGLNDGDSVAWSDINYVQTEEDILAESPETKPSSVLFVG